ncbi:MAG: hypothetical protein JRH11_24650 [Deltaproteobacteria bacterium]|nr:hypothetical protein [Deltaproteobacteria bacterium]
MRFLGFFAPARSALLALLTLTTAGTVVLAGLAGCSTFPESFTCTSNSQCTRQNSTGICINNACAFNDLTCRSGLSYDSTAPGGIAGDCVTTEVARDSGTDDDSGGLLNDCGGTTTLPARIFDPCGACGLGHYECASNESLRCVDEPTLRQVITSAGTVSASSRFSPTYPASEAVDGDLTTSWFSAGPESDGSPTIFDWTLTNPECIVGMNFTGNGRHPEFPTDYGFGSMTVQVLDVGGGIQYSRVFELPGTPDPGVNLEFDAYGATLRLLFTGHESSDCGGFAELDVTVAR